MPSYEDSRDFRERVRFERRREAGDDGYGNIQYEWQTIAGPLAARMTGDRGSEEVQAGRLIGVGNVEIVVRSSSATRALNTGDRAVDQRSGVTWNIRSITNPDERSAYLLIAAESGVAT